MPETVSQRYAALVARAEKNLAGAADADAGDSAAPAGAEAGKVRVQVGSATCEHAAGSLEVMEEFRRHIKASGRTDVVLRRTGCTGSCSREPIVGVFVPGQVPVKYQKVDRHVVHRIFTEHILAGEPPKDLILGGQAVGAYRFEFLFCGENCCEPARRDRMRARLAEALDKAGVDPQTVNVSSARCFAICSPDETGRFVHLLVRPTNTLYRIENEADIDEIVRAHVGEGKVVERLALDPNSSGRRFLELYGDVAFFNRQSRVALRNCGVVDPERIEEYVRYGGFSALAKVLEKNDPQWPIDEVTRAKLRGRGGGGYPTGTKWAMCTRSPEKTRYLICNADEGDPGAFMDRSMLESDPCSVIEGMLIGGFAIGAQRGFFYVRAEYPLAIKRIEKAIEECRGLGLLGRDILGSGFDFDLEIRLGAGAFVCGEETALIHSIEGERGQPRIRPPYPTDEGLWDKPTVINNVETFANVAPIVNFGAEWFARLGSEKSGGTKVFALAGKAKNTGLVEVPMGTTLREVLFDIGGGVAGGKQIKAIQTGGPAGGCIPAKWLDTPVDYDSLREKGSIMGSGGMIVLDEDDCMVDVAKYFMTFSQDESCGKCTPCREGTKRMLEILERITAGRGEMRDLEKLRRLGVLMKKASLCGLGRAAANPILSTIDHFREEYDAHIRDKKCPAHKCSALVHFEIDPEKCVGCTVCARACPVACISGERRKVHTIDQLRCIRCGRCFEVCRFAAVDRQ